MKLSMVVVYCFLLMSSHVFSMELNEVRKIVSFQAFDEKTMGKKIPTLCYMTEQGNLLSSETGITYELCAEHLEAMRQDASDVIGQKSLELHNDYCMQISSGKENNCARISVDYRRVDSFDYGTAPYGQSEKIKATNIRQFLSGLVPKRQKDSSNEIGNDAAGTSNDREVSRGRVILVSPFSYLSQFFKPFRYMSAQFIELKEFKIILKNDQQYNDEGIKYTGDMVVDPATAGQILRTMKTDNDTNQCFIQVALTEDEDITILLLVTKSERAKEVVQGSDIVQSEEGGDQQQQSNSLITQKKELPADKQVIQDSQSTWQQLLLLSSGVVCGIVFCVAAFLLYRHKSV
jgi:hypothetical protein